MRIDNTFAQYTARINAGNAVTEQEEKVSGKQPIVGDSFAKILEEKQKSGSVTFSKHAQTRMQERNISLDETDMQKLESAVQQANKKGVQDTLVLMNNKAFIVNVSGGVVVTAMKDSDLKGNVFTNIDGAVVV